MNEHRLSIPSLLCVWSLSSHHLINKPTAIREALYDCFHHWLPRSPDHVFDQAWLHLNEFKQLEHPAKVALNQLQQEVLLERHGNWFIRPEALGAWQQGLVSRMSPLPLLAWVGASQWPMQALSHLVDDHLRHHPLNETHVHLNGSSYAEDAWLHAMQRPTESLCDFSKEWQRKGPVRDLVRTVDPSLTPAVLHRRLKEARRLRQHLMHAAQDERLWHTEHGIDVVGLCALSDRGTFSVADEIKWQTKFFSQCRAHPGARLWLDHYLRYVLLFNQFYQLTVQNEDRKGFDQFEKHATIGLRESLELDYFQRFNDVHGALMQRSRVAHYEGRFAPKAERDATHRLLMNLLGGYFKYLCSKLPPNKACHGRRSPLDLGRLLSDLEHVKDDLNASGVKVLNLRLVCHFIKTAANSTDLKFGPYRHHSLIKKHEQQSRVLARFLKHYPTLRQWIKGVDGAGNELNAWPESLAPVFPHCALIGLGHKTFHAGEDFHHLLSGLAYMLDAVELIDLQSGDRLGHGTAMGIDPQLWLDRMPQEILIPRGEWYLAILNAWRLCMENPAGHAEAVHALEAELAKRTVELFGHQLNPHLCVQAMALRRLNPVEVHRWRVAGEPSSKTWPLAQQRRKEREAIEQAALTHRVAFDWYCKWQFDRDLRKRDQETIQVESDFLSAAHYLHLQQNLMQKMAKRGIVLETMPSSNLRISQYKHFKEHHALRWMRVPSVLPEGDPFIRVTLGSDDPGIFANDIESEFRHLFFAAKAQGLSEQEALDRVSALNENGRIYGFGSSA